MEHDDKRSELARGDGTERDIDAVLALASAPPDADGAMARLMVRIATEPQERPARVIAFPPRRPPRPSAWRFAAAVPLAASLALGVYLGARGSLDFMMPAAITGGLSAGDDGQVDDLGGAGDAVAYAHEGMS